ncbi:mycothiol synthase [Mycolicibacterium sp. 018/SC-01/001]|uniref:mycothiol synthase n=1 Tax=Mycolicibacterium sp. 018/SC-01/001 TaxID=2592069 RepID=UPI00117F869B|nr:mycothiol synthase [Mycolicibacterium sp. 018/SC-01/001]TRW85536.1 mycothiol synthase [Mycolicibacterium sp. 018/SC-01/001]
MTTIGWHERLTEHQQHLIRDLIATATRHDGVAPVGDQVLRALPHDRTRHLLAEDGDAVVGYLDLAPAGADAPAMAELVVHPEARRRGIGAAMITTGLPAGGADTRIWAHGNLAPARATAASLDLVVVRELWQMRRPLADLPPTPQPEGVRIETYSGPAEDAELLRVNNAAFAWHPEQGGWTEADIAERRGESWFDPAGLFLAYDENTGGLLGFHWTKTHSDSLGEVYVVGVDPAAQGRGLGAALTLAGLHHLADRLAGPERAAEVMLYVESDNTAAVKTYRRLGFEVATVDAAYSRRTADHL